MNLNKNMTNIRRWTGLFSLVLVILSVGIIAARGLNLGLDFTGGMVSECRVSPTLSQQDLNNALSPVVGDTLSMVKSGEEGRWTLRYSAESKASIEQVNQSLAQLDNHAEIISSSMIGEQDGDELFDPGGMAILLRMLDIKDASGFRI